MSQHAALCLRAGCRNPVPESSSWHGAAPRSRGRVADKRGVAGIQRHCGFEHESLTCPSEWLPTTFWSIVACTQASCARLARSRTRPHTSHRGPISPSGDGLRVRRETGQRESHGVAKRQNHARRNDHNAAAMPSGLTHARAAWQAKMRSQGQLKEGKDVCAQGKSLAGQALHGCPAPRCSAVPELLC